MEFHEISRSLYDQKGFLRIQQGFWGRCLADCCVWGTLGSVRNEAGGVVFRYYVMPKEHHGAYLRQIGGQFH